MHNLRLPPGLLLDTSLYASLHLPSLIFSNLPLKSLRLTGQIRQVDQSRTAADKVSLIVSQTHCLCLHLHVGMKTFIVCAFVCVRVYVAVFANVCTSPLC